MDWIAVMMKLSLFIAGAFVSAVVGISPEFQNVLQNTHRSNEYEYPTDFTRGIMPVSPAPSCVFILRAARLTISGTRSRFIRISESRSLVIVEEEPSRWWFDSDYWRDIPFYTGLSKGCMSTEADVWLYNGTLFVSSTYLAPFKNCLCWTLYRLVMMNPPWWTRALWSHSILIRYWMSSDVRILRIDLCLGQRSSKSALFKIKGVNDLV